jgi:hypothetical protein
MKRYNWIQTIVTIIVLLGSTTAIFLYTNGYRLEKQKTTRFDLTRTGMVSAKSVPEGASVYLDGILITATNDSIPGIEPGMKTLKILKKGFVPWEKQLEIHEELVTDITAVLITQSPRIEPITNTGAYNPSVSPSLSKLAYFSKEETTAGINILSLNNGFFGGNTDTILKDTRSTKYSEGKNIIWSYDESKLLLEMPNDIWYLIDLQTKTAHTTNIPENITTTWRQDFVKKRADFINNAKAEDRIKELAKSNTIQWSPDEKKFLNIEDVNGNYVYKVYNLEEPLPVGEKLETTVFTINKSQPQPKISWYTDSYHLILAEGDITKTNRGSISFIRIDGTNKTEIYNNTLFSDKVYATPSGDKVVIITSFKSNGEPDLYTVSIR